MMYNSILNRNIWIILQIKDRKSALTSSFVLTVGRMCAGSDSSFHNFVTTHKEISIKQSFKILYSLTHPTFAELPNPRLKIILPFSCNIFQTVHWSNPSSNLSKLRACALRFIPCQNSGERDPHPRSREQTPHRGQTRHWSTASLWVPSHGALSCWCPPVSCSVPTRCPIQGLLSEESMIRV